MALDELREAAVRFAVNVAGNDLTKPTGFADENLIRSLGPRAAVGSYFANTVNNTTESVIAATRVFADKDSRPEQKAAAALKCFSSFTMLINATGPIGLAVGSTISAVLGIITFILDATSDHREDEMAKLEGLLRKLNAETAANEVQAAQLMIQRQLAGVRKFANNSKTWEETQLTANLTSDVSRFKLAVTGEWLRNPANQRTAEWEQVFVGYAETVTHDVALQTTILQKLSTDDSRGTLLGVLKKYGDQLEAQFDELMAAVNDCGDLWHVSLKECWGVSVTNPGRPPRPYDGWQGIDLGRVASIAISPRTDRIWTERIDAPEQNGPARLSTGAPGEMYDFDGAAYPHGVIDLCLVPWAGPDADLLLVTANGKDNTGPGKLLVNEWQEKQSRWFTKKELEREPAVSGFKGNFWEPLTRGHDFVMARAFRGLPEPADSVEGGDYQDRVYLVNRDSAPGALPQYSLWHARIQQLRRGFAGPIVEMKHIPLPPALSAEADRRFRLTVAKHKVYLYTPRAVWRADHESLLSGSGVWHEVSLPSGTDWNSCTAHWERGSRWWSYGVNDLHAWSDNDVVGVFGNGALFSGHFDAADRRKWKVFDLLLAPGLADVGMMPQGGRQLIVVAEVQKKLHFRVYGADREVLIDTDETKLKDQIEQIKGFRVQMGDPWPSDPGPELRASLITGVTQFLGAAWKWKEMPGGTGRFILKRKHASWDFCRALHQAGANLSAGRIDGLALPAEA